MDYIHDLVEELLNDEQASVLATVVAVDGSAYRKTGASMVLKIDGSRCGLLSAGCLEADLQCRVGDLFQTGSTAMIPYDLSAEDDLGWGQGVGCNGVVYVLARDINSAFRHALMMANERLQKKEAILYVQSLQNTEHFSFISEDGDSIGNGQTSSLANFVHILQTARPFCDYAQQQTIDGENFFLQIFWPKPDLYIIGAGEDARPLAMLAGQMDYHIHMLDWREALCNKIHFPLAKTFHIGDLEELITTLPFHRLDTIIIMTHHFERDRRLLQILKDKQVFYIGILGSKKRTARLMGGNIPDWLHSPIGLPINAEGPKEIAISILAELIATRKAEAP